MASMSTITTDTPSISIATVVAKSKIYLESVAPLHMHAFVAQGPVTFNII